ncbi:MAG: ABC transporter substrate-binding protein [Phycisphaeraceae bacterium]|nr:ABC transporter substrate-binding protein [Phycisphaeraceae bacterium]
MLKLLSASICALAAASLLLLSAAPLPAAPTAPSAPAEEAQPAKKLRIGVSVPAADHGWTAGIGWWARRAMALYPEADWTFTTAHNPEKQIADIEDMMLKGVDGLVILATESAPLTPVARKAHEAGIFIVNVDRGFLEPVADIFLEGDNKAFGRKSAEFIAEKMGGKGNLVILTGIPCTVDSDRVNAALEVFRRYPDIRILAQQPAMWSRQKALEVMENMLTRFPRIDAVWAADDDMALGVIQAIRESGRQREMWVFPGAGMKEVVKMVMDRDPMIPANITYSPSMIAAGIHTAYSVLRDGKRKQVMEFMPRHILIDVELITPENAKDYYFPDAVY